jgi:FkbH-like protein
MARRASSQLDYGKLVKAAKKTRPDASWRELRVALLGDCALQQVVPPLKALFAEQEIAAEIYEAGYDTADTESHDPSSGMYAFAPQAVVLLESVQRVRDAFFASEDREEFVRAALARIEARWSAIERASQAIVLQANFPLPVERVFGNYDRKLATSLTSVVARINAGIAERAAEHKSVFVNDVEHLASYVGRRTWFDDKLWTLSKSYCALDHLPLVAQNVVDIALASRGAVVKCVVVDLDNTLWGGVIGDDGVEGIRLGHLGDGEAFVAVQRFILELKRRGLVVAVCSKNEHATALIPFREHPEMVLREQDITMFVANWKDKAENITLIKETLNIGYDSIVFLDDNPFERNLVREVLPEVIVPELPEDPAEYVSAIADLNLFETTSFSALDRERAELYRTAAQREETKRSFTTVDDYLRSLEMTIDVRGFTDFDLPRIAQLIQRSNQFNLATRRFTEAQCAAFARDPAYHTVSVSLRDKFGDYGLISVVVVRFEGPAAFVEEYLMSCRVLQRGVEHYVMTHLFETARARGASRVEGVYVPTKKNGMVKAFYEQFGFRRSEPEEQALVRWTLDVADYHPRATYLRPASRA